MDPASSGTLIDPQGNTRHLNRSDFTVKPTGAWTSPHTQTKYPAGWEITIPGAGYRLKLTPTAPDQEIRSQAPAKVTYWEGQVKIEGDQKRRPGQQAWATPNSPAMPGGWAPGFKKGGKGKKGKRGKGLGNKILLHKL